ncbi:MAG: hypothetical protein RBQ95_00965 [Paracholeplasma sp.]|nr:hypothetical protein [Paracholeplasma sp.]MDY3195401.1 hypothetical protein [Paracholeplasma sp.]
MSYISGFFDLEKSSLEEQLRIAKELDMKYIGLRKIDEKMIHELSESDIKRANELLKQNKLTVSVVEISYDQYHILEDESFSIIEKAFSNADNLHAKVVSIKLPQIDDFDTQSTMLLDWIKKVYQLTKKSKFELSFNYREGYLSGHLAYLVSNIKQINFIYDGTMFYQNQISTTTVYRLLRNVLSSIKINDITKDFEACLIGLGNTNIIDIIKKLKRDKFKGFIMLDNNLTDYLQNRDKSYEKKSIFTFFSKKKSNKERYLKMDSKLGLNQESQLTYGMLLKAEKTIIEKIIE